MSKTLATPELSEDERATVDYYNRTDWRRPAQYWDPWINRFADHLPDPAHVIEIGCGEAYPADVLRERGHRYTGTDIATHFVELALQRDPSLDVHHAFADDLPYEADSFDGWLALNVLQHIERDHLPQVIAEARRVLRDGAMLFCTVAHHPEDDPGCDRRMWDKRSLGMPSTRLFVFWDRPEVQALFESYGFELVEYSTAVTNTAGVNGQSVHWHELTLRLRK